MSDIRFVQDVDNIFTKNHEGIINIALPSQYSKIFSESKDSNFNILMHKSILQSSNLITESLRGLWDYKDVNDIKYAYQNTLFFHLRFFLHRWMFYTYCVHQAVKKHSPKRIFVDESSNDFLSQVLNKYIEDNGVDIVIMKENNDLSKSKKKGYFLVKLLLNILTRAFFIIRLPFIKNKKILLVADDSYNMISLVREIQDKYQNIFPIFLNIDKQKFWVHLKNSLLGRQLFFVQYVDKKNTASNLNDALKDFSLKISNYSNKSFFSFLGVDLSSILSRFVLGLHDQKLASLHKSISLITNILHKTKPILAISQHALGYSYALGELCSRKKIPSLLITHGTHSSNQRDELAKMEWSEHARTIFNAHFSHTAIQSPMAGNFFQILDNTYSLPLKTGPLLFAKIKTRSDLSIQELIGVKHANKNIVMHAGTPKSDQYMRPWVYETIDEYIRNVNDLINAVDCLENTYLIIRFRASEGLSKELFLQLIENSDNYGVYSEGEFSEYLSIADLLVSYSSTTIEEALQNNVPVLQYDHDDKYMHIEAPKINQESFKISPIYFCGHQKNLTLSIERILENKKLIQSNREKWETYRYSVDEKLLWFDELCKYNQFKPIH